MTTAGRTEVLRQLVEGRVPVETAARRLRDYAWDSEAVLVTLTARDLIRVLDMYLRRERSAREVEEWANVIEGREDVGYDGPGGDEVKQLVFKLANPLLSERRTPAIARAWKASLDS